MDAPEAFAGQALPYVRQLYTVALRMTGNHADAEIAQAMGVPLGTVMSRLHRGRSRLRESLAGHAREFGLQKTG